MNEKRKPVVGETLVMVTCGNLARSRGPVCKPGKVISVGRKYFKVLKDESVQYPKSAEEFHLGSWRQRTDYTPCYELFETEEQWRGIVESQEIRSYLRADFLRGDGQSMKLSLEDLRKIKAIVDGAGKENLS